MIIFPAIDLRNGQCVQLRQGDPRTAVVHDADPVRAAQRWVQQGAQWLHVVNLDGALSYTRQSIGSAATDVATLPINLRALAAIRQAVDVPIQFAGGLRSLADLKRAVSLGADRLVLGTAAVDHPALVDVALTTWGPERIVVAIEVRDGAVVTHGWQQRSSVAPEALGQQMYAAGVRRVLFTNVVHEGMLGGVDVTGPLQLGTATGLRVIASGGVATLDDIEALASVAREVIEGVVLGQAIYTGRLTVADAIRVAASGRA